MALSRALGKTRGGLGRWSAALSAPAAPAPAAALRWASARRYVSAAIQEFDPFNPSEEHQMLRDVVRQFAEEKLEPQALEYDRAEETNWPLFKELGELGLLGISAPERHGGSGMDATACVIAHEELSAVDPGFCLTYLAHSMLFVNNVVHNGNDEQKARFLPKASTGELIGGMCMSEPGAGTDVLGMATTARQSEDKESWILNGRKMWITNGAVNATETGDAFLVYARTGPSRQDVTMFIVEKGMGGFSLGQKLRDKLGMRASSTAELVFDDVEVPARNVVGDVNGALVCMMRNLELERLTLAAMSLGMARRAIEVMNAYAKDRQAFGKPINSFGQIQAHIGQSYAEWMAGRSYVYNTANRLQLNAAGQRLDSDGVKLFCGRMATTITDRAIQVLGGYGYVGEYAVERLWRDARLIEIGGGTNEAHQKNMVAELKKIERLP